MKRKWIDQSIIIIKSSKNDTYDDLPVGFCRQSTTPSSESNFADVAFTLASLRRRRRRRAELKWSFDILLHVA